MKKILYGDVTSKEGVTQKIEINSFTNKEYSLLGILGGIIGSVIGALVTVGIGKIANENYLKGATDYMDTELDAMKKAGIIKD